MKLNKKSALKYSYILAFPFTFLLLSWLMIDNKSPDNIMVPVLLISVFLNFIPAFILEAFFCKVFSSPSLQDIKTQKETSVEIVTHRKTAKISGSLIFTLIFGPVVSYFCMLFVQKQNEPYLSLLAIFLGFVVTFFISKVWLNKNT